MIYDKQNVVSPEAGFLKGMEKTYDFYRPLNGSQDVTTLIGV